MNKRDALRPRPLLLLLLALCLCPNSAAAAQEEKERLIVFKPTAAQRAEAERLRGALAAAVGDNFEVARQRLVQRPRWHGGAVYWLAYLLAKHPGEYYVQYKYRYKDHVNPHDPLYDFVEHKTRVRVGPRGCDRAPRSNSICAGDTFVLPVLFDDYTGHAFSLVAQPFTPGGDGELRRRVVEDGEPYNSAVPNPAARFLNYLGDEWIVEFLPPARRVL